MQNWDVRSERNDKRIEILKAAKTQRKSSKQELNWNAFESPPPPSQVKNLACNVNVDLERVLGSVSKQPGARIACVCVQFPDPHVCTRVHVSVVCRVTGWFFDLNFQSTATPTPTQSNLHAHCHCHTPTCSTRGSTRSVASSARSSYPSCAVALKRGHGCSFKAIFNP